MANRCALLEQLPAEVILDITASLGDPVDRVMFGLTCHAVSNILLSLDKIPSHGDPFARCYYCANRSWNNGSYPSHGPNRACFCLARQVARRLELDHIPGVFRCLGCDKLYPRSHHELKREMQDGGDQRGCSSWSEKTDLLFPKPKRYRHARHLEQLMGPGQFNHKIGANDMYQVARRIFRGPEHGLPLSSLGFSSPWVPCDSKTTGVPRHLTGVGRLADWEIKIKFDFEVVVNRRNEFFSHQVERIWVQSEVSGFLDDQRRTRVLECSYQGEQDAARVDVGRACEPGCRLFASKSLDRVEVFTAQMNPGRIYRDATVEERDKHAKAWKQVPPVDRHATSYECGGCSVRRIMTIYNHGASGLGTEIVIDIYRNLSKTKTFGGFLKPTGLSRPRGRIISPGDYDLFATRPQQSAEVFMTSGLLVRSGEVLD